MNDNPSVTPVVGRKYFTDCYFEVSGPAVSLGYPSQITFTRVRAVGIQPLYGNPVAFTNTGLAGAIDYLDCSAKNFDRGMDAPTTLTCRIDSFHVDALTGIKISNVIDPNGRHLVITNLVASTISPAVLSKIPFTRYNHTYFQFVQGRQQVDVMYRMDMGAHSLYDATGTTLLAATNPLRFAVQNDFVTLNGENLYMPEESPNFSLDSIPTRPALLAGMTNGQLYQQFGIAIGGLLLPTDAQTTSRVYGLLSYQSATALPPVQVNKAITTNYQITNTVTGYVAIVKDSKGNFVSSAPTNLTPDAWNIITVVVDGRKRGVWVYCDTKKAAPLSWDAPKPVITPTPQAANKSPQLLQLVLDLKQNPV